MQSTTRNLSRAFFARESTTHRSPVTLGRKGLGQVSSGALLGQEADYVIRPWVR
jgi:hypothetical protein